MLAGDIGMPAMPEILDGYWLDAMALFGAAGSVALVHFRRRALKFPGLTRDQAQGVFFSGASIIVLSLLAVSAWNEAWLAVMLQQERLILVAAVIFAIWDEGQRVVKYCKAT